MNELGFIDDFVYAIDPCNDMVGVAVALRDYMGRLGFEKFSYQILKSPLMVKSGDFAWLNIAGCKMLVVHVAQAPRERCPRLRQR